LPVLYFFSFPLVYVDMQKHSAYWEAHLDLGRAIYRLYRPLDYLACHTNSPAGAILRAAILWLNPESGHIEPSPFE
jgi:hypothetical protein